MQGALEAGLVALAAAAAEEGAFNPLSVNPLTFAAQAVNVLVVMVALYYLLFRPLGDAIARRERFVSESLDGARQARDEAERLKQEMERTLEEARRRAQEELQRAVEVAEQERARRLKQADEEARRMVEQARAEIRAEREQALAALREEAASLAVMAASRLLQRNIEDEDQLRMAREFVRQVGDHR